MTVMVVDDHPLVRQGIISILSSNFEDCNIFEADTVEKALKVQESKMIDIALVDLLLRGESGFDFIREVKKKEKALKIIIISSSLTRHDLELANELGVEGYILKDAFIEDILYAIKVVQRNEKYYSTAVLSMMRKIYRENSSNHLTKREREVFQLLKEGKTNAEISSILYISPTTTKKHVSNILSKLNMKHRVEAALYEKLI